MRRYRISLSAVSLVAAAAFPTAARADDVEDLKRSQEELRKLVESQQKEIDRLRGEMSRGKGAEGPALADSIDQLSKKADNSGPVVWKQVSKKGSKFTLYGFVRADAQWDSSRPNNHQLIQWARTDDSSAPDSIRAPNGKDDFNIHSRLTRLGLDFDGPTVAALNDAKVTGKVEVDFYLLPASNSRAGVRMRHGYGKLTWCEDFSLLFGQTAEVISPLMPIVNNDMVMWNAGNLGDRRPQVRLEYAPVLEDDSVVILQGAVGSTGAIDGQDLDATGTGAGYLDGETSGLPTLQARAAYRFQNWEDKTSEIGIWGHTAWEDPDSSVGFTGTSGTGSFRSNAIGLDVSLPVWEDSVFVKAELWKGSNLDDVRGGIGQGVNTVVGDEIEASGGWIELGWRATDWLTLYAGYSRDNPDNGDLRDGGAVGGRSDNEILYLASRMKFDPVEIGLEYLHWNTEFIGFDDGDLDRVVAFVAYSF